MYLENDMRVHPARGKCVIKDIGRLVYVGERVETWVLTPSRIFKADGDGALVPITIRHAPGYTITVQGVELICDPSALEPSTDTQTPGVVPTPAGTVVHRLDVYMLKSACSPDTSCQLVIDRETKGFHWEVPDGCEKGTCAAQLGAFLDSIEITPCH